MKTDDLIELLAKDNAPQWSFRMLFSVALICSVAVAGVLFFAMIGVRHDFLSAAETMRFLMKFVVTVTLAVGAVGLAQAMARPGAEFGAWPWLLVAAPALLMVAVVVELSVVPSEAWTARLVGQNASFCLKVIPLLSLGPFALLLLVLRRGAPSNPGCAGTLAGLASGAIAATFYAAHCPDDSPLFVAAWYSIAVTIMGGFGYLAGRRLLRW
ncbi:MAG TPA: NrsF family protein [Ancylobacter sp.]